MALTTVERVARELVIDETDSRYGVIADAIAAASNFIQTYCDREFEKMLQAREFVVDYNSVPNILIVGDYTPVIDNGGNDITTVETRGTASSKYQTLDKAEYNYYPVQHTTRDTVTNPYYAIYFVNTPPCIQGFPSVRVTANWGWNIIPFEVTMAATIVAAGLVQHETFAVSEEIMLPTIYRVKMLLEQYKRVTI